MPSTDSSSPDDAPAAFPGGRLLFGRVGNDDRWIALILFVLWLVGFFVRRAEGARWYGR